MESKEDLSTYDQLECRWCDELCKVTSVTSKGTAVYKHDCASGAKDFRIDINGDLIE